ncbi:MAG TPA: glycosyl hydrolase family 28-related protein [Candidatus Saccharimonadales bacterium]|nr:glycosyl hydrolase family 28-related protein [Candidatus Saccharimonadales bacterium]
MARLPVPGGDVDAWAAILNEYLLITHNSDGSQKADSVGSAALQSRSIGIRHLRTMNAANTPLKDFVLSNTGNELVWKTPEAVVASARDLEYNVADYGAVGDGITDDTEAVQAAIDAATNGGSVVFPRGVFMVSSLKIRKHGVTLVGSARLGTRVMRISGTEPLVDISGTGTLDNHIKYCSISNIMLCGSSMPGPLLRSYFADNCVYREVSFVHCNGTATDFVEVWDSRFQACSWEDCGSTAQPALLLRNTMPEGQFGYGTDNTNQIHFHSCRWEGFRNGAVRLYGSANGSPNLLNGVFFVSCKMETRFAAGSAFQIMEGTTIVFVNQLYIAIMAPDAGYTARVDAIEDRGTQVFIADVYVQWGHAKGMAGHVAHVWNGEPHTYQQISSFFPTEESNVPPFVQVESAAKRVMLLGLWANQAQRKRIGGLIAGITIGGPGFGYFYPIDITGVFRIMSLSDNKDILRVNNNPSRPVVAIANSADIAGYSDNDSTEKWRLTSSTGAARFAAGKFQVEPTKGYVGINSAPAANIAVLIRAAADGDKSLVIIRPSNNAINRLMEFQDETYNIQGQAFDSNGRPVAVGTPARVTPGSQVSYANPGIQVRDIAGNITAAVKPSPTAPGTIATLTFSRPYATTPLKIAIHDHSAAWSNLYVSARSTTGFTVSTRNALQGGAILDFDYSVVA